MRKELPQKLFSELFSPRSADEDSERKEFILNVLLVSSIALFSAAIVASMIASVLEPEPYARNSVPFLLLVFIFTFFLSLFVLSRRGYFKGSAYILILMFFTFALLLEYRWGVDVNAALLIYGLVIVMAGILVSTRFAFIMTGLIGLALFALGSLQSAHVLPIDHYWRTESWEAGDTAMTIIIFLVVATVSWLSNREIERSLRRAHASERDLRTERDHLEVTVEERTRKLKEAQIEKVAQLYRFAEFGRLSSGLFHDLMNPLTAVSLNMEKAQSEDGKERNANDLSRAQLYLNQAFRAAKRMEQFITAVRKQIGKDDEKKQFFVREEIEQVIEILSYKAHNSHVRLIFSGDPNISIIGIPVRFSQIMLNLITNGIDAYDTVPHTEKNRDVEVSVSEDAVHVRCIVRDHGAGIKEEHFEKIFEPFFTTKAGESTKGTGIGLSMVKDMIEKDFRGTITVTSTPQSGTVFSFLLPK